ncbi:MAG: YhdP family protein [Dechloromonas sp.]|nr:YhdP family protein [Dechloromonas sp.]
MNKPRQPLIDVFRILRPLFSLLARPRVARGMRLAGWLLFGLWLGFVALQLALRYVVLPRVADYQPQIERAASRAVGQPVRIGRIETRWQGLNPDLVLDDVAVLDRAGQPAVSLARVEAVLSWESLWRLQPTLALLALERPLLHVRRTADGRITVAGINTAGGDDPAFAEWLLRQKRIRVRDATVVWDDQLRRAPPLILEDLQFGLDNRRGSHRFGLSAAPPGELAARLDLRGEVAGELGQAIEHYSGKVFVELDYADLAGWRPWLDYPVAIPSGRGALRVWGDLGDGSGRLTADVALEDLRIRLGSKLPELSLVNMRGRLSGSYRDDAWSLAGNRVELLAADGTRVAPSDFQAEWRRDPRDGTVDGKASATYLDLAVLARLAGYLPLDPGSRGLLQRHRPQGQIADLRAAWRLEGETLSRYSLQAGFAGLGLAADGNFPGAGGLSGRVDLTEQGGQLALDTQAATLSLPGVFPEPDLRFDSLGGRARWQRESGRLTVNLEQLAFSSPDATGSARGTYRYDGSGPGEIDLTASIDRADGSAVWRYMPHAVNADTRAWLKRGIVSGRASDGRLVLRGNLKDFPFRDPATGSFSVTAKAHDTKIDYAPGWPVIEHVEADMSFGIGMKIRASAGQILGAQLSGVSADIPDFESHEEMLLVRGVAQGETGEFLRFIDQSPVAETIDRFTEGMKASGRGRLDLALDIPLRHALDTRLRGDYLFQNNQLQPLAGLPPLTQVHGRLQITENTVTASEITSRGFGGPLKVQVRSAGGKVAVLASGTAGIGEVARHFGWPLVDQLSGNTAWKAEIGIRKRNADVVVTSDLVGISSPLPDPLNKTATAVLPLRVERTAPDAEREQYRITLGKVAQGLVVRRGETWERGVFAIGDGELRLPDKGLAVRVSAPRIDADAWRNYLPEAGGTNGSSNGNGGGLELGLVTLKTPLLHLFDRDYSQVDVVLRPRDGGWQIGLNTREATGDVFWRGDGDGWVEGSFKRLVVRPASEIAETDGGTTLINTLPGMNLAVDDFRIGETAFGRLELKARNDRGAWVLERLLLKNPDGALNGRGVWKNVGRHQTRLDFELNAADIGRLLDRLGHADSVRRGSATLKGELRWDGPLTGIDYPTLSGQMTIAAAKGQFNKLEPGVGKLLGLISLQSLPRRLTLDFRDIFSDGLAFDSIEGKVAVTSGVMRTTEPLRIFGPAAQIEIQGETHLQKETQDLMVVVRPEVGGLAAVGAAALAHPAVGAAALVANTVLQKPLNRLFSYRYHVTGNWSDPQVDQAGTDADKGKP